MAHTFATRESILSVSIVLIPAQVAIKLFRKPRDSEKATPAHHEIFIFQDVKRQHIVRLHELVETSRHLGLVLTYYSGGNLVTYIFTHNHVEEQLASRMFAQLVSALGYLHEKGIVHGSILIENLLLDDNENLFISSLALVRKYGPRTETGGSSYRSKLGYSIIRGQDGRLELWSNPGTLLVWKCLTYRLLMWDVAVCDACRAYASR